MNSTIVNLNKIIKKGILDSELDFEHASIIERKLRVLAKEQPDLNEKRRQIRAILKEYEEREWSRTENITAAKIQENDLAEMIAEQERLFLHNRKHLIRKRLQELSISQKDLGKILGHTSVSYISELVNGINPFTTHDLIIIHLLLKIDFKDLIPTMLNVEERLKLAHVIQELSNPKLKLNEQSLELVAS